MLDEEALTSTQNSESLLRVGLEFDFLGMKCGSSVCMEDGKQMKQQILPRTSVAGTSVGS